MNALTVIPTADVDVHPGGRCKYCGCTDYLACIITRGNVRFSCWWVDKDHTVCSSAACFAKFKQELRQKAGRA